MKRSAETALNLVGKFSKTAKGQKAILAAAAASLGPAPPAPPPPRTGGSSAFAKGFDKVLDQICSSAKGGRPTREAEELGFNMSMITATGLIDTALLNEIWLVGEVKKMLKLSVRIVTEGVRRAIEFSGTGTYAPYVSKKRLAYERSVVGETLNNWMHNEQGHFPPDPNLRVVQVGWTKEYLKTERGEIKRWRQVEGDPHPARKCAFR